ncbi:MAG: hypothetical protein QM770_05760 [Tepidisphaeraceae bacterium]
MSDEPTTPALQSFRQRVSQELAYSFAPERAVFFGHALGRIDVMGGVAALGGSPVVALSLDRGVQVALQPRDDGQLQVFSFDLFDQHKPFTLQASADAICTAPRDALKQSLAEPGRSWAAIPLGCVRTLREAGVDVRSGLSIAFQNSLQDDEASDAALSVAVHRALAAWIGSDEPSVESYLAATRLFADVSPTMADVVACKAEVAGVLLQIDGATAQSLTLPEGLRVVTMRTGVHHDRREVGARLAEAAQRGHAHIFEQMRELGARAGRELIGDPMAGHVGNLEPADYKRFFRPRLPEELQDRVDHLVLDARRTREFIRHINEARSLQGHPRKLALDKAGHRMYAAHSSLRDSAGLGDDVADRVVEQVRRHEHVGLYGARLTDRGQGGTIAVLCNASESARESLAQFEASV